MYNLPLLRKWPELTPNYNNSRAWRKMGPAGWVSAFLFLRSLATILRGITGLRPCSPNLGVQLMFSLCSCNVHRTRFVATDGDVTSVETESPIMDFLPSQSLFFRQTPTFFAGDVHTRPSCHRDRDPPRLHARAAPCG